MIKERDEQLKSKEYGSILRKLSKRTSGHPSLNREMNHLEGGMYYVGKSTFCPLVSLIRHGTQFRAHGLTSGGCM